MKITVFFAEMGYSVKLLSKQWATLIPQILENMSNFLGRGLPLVAYNKNKCIRH